MSSLAIACNESGVDKLLPDQTNVCANNDLNQRSHLMCLISIRAQSKLQGKIDIEDIENADAGDHLHTPRSSVHTDVSLVGQTSSVTSCTDRYTTISDLATPLSTLLPSTVSGLCYFPPCQAWDGYTLVLCYPSEGD